MNPVSTGEEIEVKWLLEFRIEEWRRKGQDVSKTIWWKARVTNIELVNGALFGTVCYEEGHGIVETKMRARFMGRKLSHIGEGCENMARQTWRSRQKNPLASESNSGTVSETVEEVSLSDPDFTPNTNVSSFHAIHDTLQKSRGSRCSIQHTSARIANLELKVDELERLVSAQSAIYSRIIGNEGESDRVAERVFRYLRHKMVHRCHKPLSFPRARSAISDVERGDGRFVGMCFTSLLRVDANCSLSDFAKIATVIRSRCPRATFQPSLCEAQSPTQGLQESQVLFDSLHDISQCIRLGGHSDLLALVAKGKKINGAEVAEYCALRLFGGTLAENEDGKHPFIFRLAGSLHGTLPNGVFDVLRRENRRFDYRNSVYVNKLERSRVSMHEAISESGVVIGEDGDIYSATDSAFALRWSRLSTQYSRHLPNAARGQNEVLGILELAWPALIVRSKQVVAEFRVAITQEMLGRSVGPSQ